MRFAGAASALLLFTEYDGEPRRLGLSDSVNVELMTPPPNPFEDS